MSRKKDSAPASSQEELAVQDNQNTVENETISESSAAPNEDENAGLVKYKVNAPRGIYLRVGPGRAFHQLAVLNDGAEIMGTDLAGMLRPNRKLGDSAWVKVLTKSDGTGWVDGAFLERVC